MKTVRTDSVRGYRLDFGCNTLYLNYTFAEKAQKDFLSAEAKRLRQIKKAFPTIQVVVEAGCKITTTRPTKRLTYKNMEIYIDTLDNAEEMLALFDKIKRESKVELSPYKYVRDWFKEQFPDYKTAKVFQETKKPADSATVSDNVTEFPTSEQEQDEKKPA